MKQLRFWIGETYCHYNSLKFYAVKLNQQQAMKHLQTSLIVGDMPLIRIATRFSLGKWFPITDVDSEEAKNLAVTWLDNNHSSYSLIESSPGKYWIIHDTLLTKKRGIEYYCPGNDPQFVSFCRSYKYLGMRGFSKNGFIPHLVKVKNISDNMKEFLYFVIEWFSHPIMKDN
jgi:hypothetical protein